MKIKLTIALAFCGVCSFALAPLSTLAQDIQGSVITVNQMKKIDDAQALQRAQDDAIKMGVANGGKPPSETKKVEIPLPVWTVRSIFGSGPVRFADLAVDSTLIEGATVGADVSMCRVAAIQNACVSLVSRDKKTRRGSCPEKTCWTGTELAAELRPALAKPAEGSGYRVMPSPLPATPLPLPQAAAQPSALAATKPVTR